MPMGAIITCEVHECSAVGMNDAFCITKKNGASCEVHTRRVCIFCAVMSRQQQKKIDKYVDRTENIEFELSSADGNGTKVIALDNAE